MADDRRILTATSLLITEGNTTEAGVRKWVKESVTTNDTFGSSGARTYTDIADNRWGTNWFGTKTVDAGGVVIADNSSNCILAYIENTGGVDMYISLTAEETWDGTWSTNNNWDDSDYSDRGNSYDGWWDEGATIELAVGASLYLRGDASNLKLNEIVIYSKIPGRTGTIEYLLSS